MSDIASWVSAGFDLVVAVSAAIYLARDELQARKARRETVEVVRQAAAEKVAIAEHVEKVTSPDEALLLAHRIVDPEFFFPAAPIVRGGP